MSKQSKFNSPRKFNSTRKFNSPQCGSSKIFALASAALIIGILYVGHLIVSCYRFAQFQSSLRDYVEMDSHIDEIIKDPRISAYVDNDESGIKLIRSVQHMMSRNNFDNLEKHLQPIAASNRNANSRIREAVELLRQSQDLLNKMGKNWQNYLKIRAQETSQFIQLRQESAELLSVELTNHELNPELNEVDVTNTGRLPFYVKGELKNLPMLENIPNPIMQSELVDMLARTYQRQIERLGKEQVGDPAGLFRRLQIRSRHLSQENKHTAKKLQTLHMQIIQTRMKIRGARNTIQGVLYMLLENSKRPHFPKWVPKVYNFIRHHAQKFGQLLPEVEEGPSY